MLHFSILVGQTNCILKDTMSGFMSLKIKIIFKPKLKDMSINESYQNTFIKGSKKSQTCTFCNYYCHIGHISLDCKLRKENNIANVVWVPKDKN
jgi:hypothetical protein